METLNGKDDLLKIIATAGTEKWTDLTVIGPCDGNVVGEHCYKAVYRLVDDGARALGALTNLTTLDLGGNSIGDDGARALGGLVNLTSLNLWGNDIGADGARQPGL